MAEGTGKTKIKEVKIELYVDDEIRKGLQDILDGKKDTLELSQVYFRHLQIEEFKHEGLKLQQLKIPVGRVTKLKLKFTGH